MSEQIDVIEQPVTVGPGERLRSAREARELTHGDVAKALHLSESKVMALEADDYAGLPGRVFIQGYLRKYARLVEMDEAPLLAAFEELCPDTHPVTCPSVGTPVKPEVRSSHGLVRLVTWGILIATGTLLVLAVRGYLDWPAEPAMTDQEQAVEQPVVVDDAIEPALAALETVEVAVEQSVPSKPSRTESATADGDADTIAPALKPSPVQASDGPAAKRATDTEGGTADEPAATSVTTSPEVASAALVASASDAADGTASAEVSEPTVVEAESPPEPVPAAKPDVVFEFTKNCWVDIRASGQDYKLFGEIAAGRSETLGGTPPYRVVLGNAAAVQINVAGKPFDLAAHSRGNVARFTLDPSRP